MREQKTGDDLRLDRPIEADEPVGGQSRPLTMLTSADGIPVRPETSVPQIGRTVSVKPLLYV
jgi:hypothetical protein